MFGSVLVADCAVRGPLWRFLDNPAEAEETYCGIRLLDYVLSVDRIGIVAGERFCRDVLASIGVFDAIDD